MEVALIGLAGVALGFALRCIPMPGKKVGAALSDEPTVAFMEPPADGHVHVFAKMRKDGWWICAACGERAPDNKQPKLRTVKS